MRSREIIAVLLVVIVSIFLVAFGCPKYKVYKKTHDGIAMLKQAEHSRMILVEQAKAEKDAASLRAEAIKIVGQAAKEFPEYRNQEFIGAFSEAMMNGAIDKIIYVPTEASIPIVEAGRMGVQK